MMFFIESGKCPLIGALLGSLATIIIPLITVYQLPRDSGLENISLK